MHCVYERHGERKFYAYVDDLVRAGDEMFKVISRNAREMMMRRYLAYLLGFLIHSMVIEM